MAARRVSLGAKGVEGRSVEVPSALVPSGPAKRRAMTEKEEELQRKKTQKIADARRSKTHAKNADVGFASCGDVLLEKDKTFILDWIDDGRQHIAAHLVSLCRNGMVEKSYAAASAKTVAQASSLGKKIVKALGLKWQAIPPQSCIYLLGRLLGAEVAQWWQKPDPLPGALAQKGLQTMMAVSARSWLPQGHDDGNFEGPLMTLLAPRWAQLGHRCRGSTKETFDTDSDYYVLVCEPWRVKMNFVLGDVSPYLDLGLDFSQANDWLILSAHDFANAELVSVAAGVQMRLAPKVKKQFGVVGSPTRDDEFHFPETVDSSSSSAGSQARSPQQESVDARVASLLSASPTRTEASEPANTE